jgi:hypothetical protein
VEDLYGFVAGLVRERHVLELDRRLLGGGARVEATFELRVRAVGVVVSSGRSSTSVMRPSAPSALDTEVTAPNALPMGVTMRNRNSRKAVRPPIVSAPDATR